MSQSDQGRRAGLHRLAAALVAVTVGLLASAAAIPAAFAREVPTGLATVHQTGTAGGLTSWQIALIGVSVPVAAVVVTVLLRRVRGARRAVHSPTA
jgi:hypothetical protein